MEHAVIATNANYETVMTGLREVGLVGLDEWMVKPLAETISRWPHGTIKTDSGFGGKFIEIGWDWQNGNLLVRFTKHNG